MRTDEEMRITLATLQAEFGVDVAPASGLNGQELAAWLERVEDEVFAREYVDFQKSR